MIKRTQRKWELLGRLRISCDDHVPMSEGKGIAYPKTPNNSSCSDMISDLTDSYNIQYKVWFVWKRDKKDLRVLRRLGSGTSGLVKEVLHIPSGETMAVKVVPLASNSDSQVFMCRELNTLRFSECPYLIDFYGATVYVLDMDFL